MWKKGFISVLTLLILFTSIGHNYVKKGKNYIQFTHKSKKQYYGYGYSWNDSLPKLDNNSTLKK